MTDSIRILNIDIQPITRNELLQSLTHGVVVTPNVDHLVKLQSDKEFYHCYCNADWVICDSKILYLCSKLLHRSIPEPIPGSSFFSAFYKHHKDDPNCRIFLLGAMDGVALKAKERINSIIGREIIVGAMSPSYGFENKPDEWPNIYDAINRSKANVVLVGVGAPKQEKWIFAHKANMPEVDIWLALGATIDFEAGNIKRAPRLFQKLALEWLYRIFQEPRRMLRRYLVDDMQFFIYFTRQLFGKYHNPFA
jgi:exopolysaccharide biosynthesis WecB/TagA/CpsF family protein